jgi:hypothetical protein
MNKELEAWEEEGGAVPFPASQRPVLLIGSPNQVEWARRIRLNVESEFDRVAASFRAIAKKQLQSKRANTEAIIAILEEKRAEVMAKEQAGYFIHDWQEIDDQVRQMISHDRRYPEIKVRLKTAG